MVKRREFEASKKVAQERMAKDVRAALYSRVSSEEQAQEGYSLEGQAERLRSYASARGWKVADLYVDAGMTATNTKRDAYQKMIAELDNWDVLVVLKMDRIHRNARNFLEMMELLAKREKEFVSMTESLDTGTAMGRFVMSILSQIAQLESEQIGERTRFGLTTKAKTGDYSLGQRAPYGYRWSEGNPKFGRGTWILIKEEAKIVKEIFDLASRGKGVPTISKRLRWCTCKPRQVIRYYTKKDGSIKRYLYNENRWDCAGCARIRYILNNPAYCGYFVWSGQILPGSHEPLITRDKFLKVQGRRYKTTIVLPPLS